MTRRRTRPRSSAKPSPNRSRSMQVTVNVWDRPAPVQTGFPQHAPDADYPPPTCKHRRWGSGSQHPVHEVHLDWTGADRYRTPEHSRRATAETREIALKRQTASVNTNASGSSEQGRESVVEGTKNEREAGRGAGSRGRG
jgi:hypothetical protein